MTNILEICKGLIMRNNGRLDTQVKDALFAAQEMYSWTPDLAQLEKRAYQPVFICCPLGKGGTEHHWIEGNYLAKDENGLSHNAPVYTKDRFELWKVNMGDNTYTVPLITGSSPATAMTPEKQWLGQKTLSARIKGRVYNIRSDLIFLLDRLRHNGVIYHRRKIDVLLPWRFLGGQQLGFNRLSDEFVHRGQVWFYIGDPFWQGLIDQEAFSGYFTPATLKVSRHSNERNYWNREPYYLFYPQEVFHNSA